jgi:hypothetical protein
MRTDTRGPKEENVEEINEEEIEEDKPLTCNKDMGNKEAKRQTSVDEVRVV